MKNRSAAALPHACTTGLIAIALAATLSSAAMAANNDLLSVSARKIDADTNVANVKIADLDLTTAVAQRALRARIASAVTAVCTFGGDKGPRLPVDRGCAGDAAWDANQQAQAVIAMAASHQSASAMPATVTVRGAR
jgi:UrcA family protein